MQRYVTKLEILASLEDWQIFYKNAQKQLSTLHQTEEIAQIQYKTLSDFLDELDKGLQAYFKLTVLVEKFWQLRSLSKQLQEFLNEQSKVAPTNDALSVLAPLSQLFNTTEEELLNLKNLPPEILRLMANDYLDSQSTLRLASTCKGLFFSDVGLGTLGISKGFQELDETRLAIGSFSNYGLAQRQLFAWGRNGDGELGLGDRVNKLTPVAFDLRRLNLSPGDKLKSIFTCRWYSFLLTQQGRCFAWGDDYELSVNGGQFVNFHEKNAPVECDLNLLNLNKDDEIEAIFPGEGRAYISTKKGLLYAWGTNSFGRLGLETFKTRDPVDFNISRLQLAERDRVRSIIMGGYHTLLLTEQGRCFAWGNNAYGQLGLGDTNNRKIPVEINLEVLNLALHDKVASIVTSPSSTFSFLLTEQGRLFYWGTDLSNEFKLVGEGSTRPVEIDLSALNLAPDDKVRTISCGRNFLLLLTEQGHGFACGKNDCGQLGLGDTQDRDTPEKIDFSRLGLMTTDKISAVSAGFESAFWSSDHRRHFVCGRNESGLGLEDQEQSAELEELSFPLARPLQKLISVLNKDHLHDLAYLVQSPKTYGRRCFQLLYSLLSTINDLSTRIFCLSSLVTSPWYQSEDLAAFLPLPALYQPLLEAIKKDSNTVTLEMAKVLSELITSYQSLAKKTAVNKKSKEKFLEFLTQLSQGGITTADDLKNHNDKLAKEEVKSTSTGMTLFETTGSSSSTTVATASEPSYIEPCQQWLDKIEKEPALLLHFKMAAELLMQAIKPSNVSQLQY